MMYQNFKKISTFFLCTTMCTLTLFGCGNSSTEQTTEPTTEETQVSTNATVTPIENILVYDLPTAAEESDIFIEPIPDLSDSFIRGMDTSTVLVEEKSGVTYYSEAGEVQDVFQTLAQAGVNYIRLRVWNDPYDENGNGYGGGNNDVPTAIELGKRATQYGMQVCIDFHYSDFWADPSKQMVPKAWKGMTPEEKSNALYTFTKDSMKQILDAGVNVGMVQIGNETNNGMSGETLIPNVTMLMSAGSRAIREIEAEYNKDIKIAVHYTNIEDFDKINRMALNLLNFGVDYDVFAISYYPFWHGTFENLEKVITHIRTTYNKDVVIAETSYCYTTEDGDCNGNSINGSILTDGYAATVQSQATLVRDICEIANRAGALGVFYWEGTWIPVGDNYEENKEKWETYGSGWASSYAAGYDPKDAGQYYGGCAWDNQAMFDWHGHPLASLNVFKYLKHGTIAPLTVDYIPTLTLDCNVGGDLELPTSIDVVYNDRSVKEQATVTWDDTSVNAVNTNVASSYEIKGTLENGTEVSCIANIALLNFVKNSSFEESDTSMWTVTYEGNSNPTDYQKKGPDAHTGDVSFHFWDESAMNFAIEQEFTNLENGIYELSAFFQGGDINTDAKMELYAVTNGSELTAPFVAAGYANWQKPTISTIEVTDGTLTIGVRIACNAKGWGTIDDFTLNKLK